MFKLISLLYWLKRFYIIVILSQQFFIKNVYAKTSGTVPYTPIELTEIKISLKKIPNTNIYTFIFLPEKFIV